MKNKKLEQQPAFTVRRAFSAPPIRPVSPSPAPTPTESGVAGSAPAPTGTPTNVTATPDVAAATPTAPAPVPPTPSVPPPDTPVAAPVSTMPPAAQSREASAPIGAGPLSPARDPGTTAEATRRKRGRQGEGGGRPRIFAPDQKPVPAGVRLTPNLRTDLLDITQRYRLQTGASSINMSAVLDAAGLAILETKFLEAAQPRTKYELVDALKEALREWTERQRAGAG